MAPSETFLRLHELSRKSRGAEYMDAAALPSASHLEREFGLFNPEGSGCCPTVDATGAVTCTCSGCERWSKYVAGTLGGEPVPGVGQGSQPDESAGSSRCHVRIARALTPSRLSRDASAASPRRSSLCLVT